MSATLEIHRFRCTEDTPFFLGEILPALSNFPPEAVGPMETSHWQPGRDIWISFLRRGSSWPSVIYMVSGWPIKLRSGYIGYPVIDYSLADRCRELFGE